MNSIAYYAYFDGAILYIKFLPLELIYSAMLL